MKLQRMEVEGIPKKVPDENFWGSNCTSSPDRGDPVSSTLDMNNRSGCGGSFWTRQELSSVALVLLWSLSHSSSDRAARWGLNLLVRRESIFIVQMVEH